MDTYKAKLADTQEPETLPVSKYQVIGHPGQLMTSTLHTVLLRLHHTKRNPHTTTHPMASCQQWAC